MSGIKHVLFGLSRFSSRASTLQSRTWQGLLEHSPGLLAIRRERRKALRYRMRNSFKGGFAVVFIAFALLVGCCFIPAGMTQRYFWFLEWFRFADVQKAYDTISEVMGATATIIGLGFVVIGFLFDIVKDKVQRTLEELFRATGLYYVFAISVLSIFTVALVNCFKYTVEPYIACNFAVLATGLLLIDSLAIAYLFGQLLRFFNPERIAAIGSRQMLDLARFQMLDDRFSRSSKEVYQERLQDYGYEEKYQFVSLLNKHQPVPFWLGLGNSKGVEIIDVHFPVLKMLAIRFNKRSAEAGFATLQSGMNIWANQGILSLENGFRLQPWERFLFPLAFLTARPDKQTNDFGLLKQQLEKRLLEAAADGNEDGIDKGLKDVENLYDLFYNSNA